MNFENFRYLFTACLKDEIVDEKLTGAADNKSSSEILDEMNAGSLLVKELHEASGKILGKLNKTTNKLDMIIKCLSTLEKIFQEVSAKTKEGEESIPLLHPPLHHQTLNQTEEIEEGGGHDDIILDLLMG